MSETWLNLITQVLSCLLAGGITGVISVRIVKRQKRAEAAQAEASAKQIENQNELQDIIILSEKISAFDKIISNLNNKLVAYIEENKVLNGKLDNLAAENKQLKRDIENISKKYDTLYKEYKQIIR